MLSNSRDLGFSDHTKLYIFTQLTKGVAIQKKNWSLIKEENKDIGQEKSTVIQCKAGSLSNRVKERLEIGSWNSDFLKEIWSRGKQRNWVVIGVGRDIHKKQTLQRLLWMGAYKSLGGPCSMFPFLSTLTTRTHLHLVHLKVSCSRRHLPAT